MTLFQYGTDISTYRKKYWHDFLHMKYYETATYMGDVAYLGLKRNSEVNINMNRYAHINSLTIS